MYKKERPTKTSIKVNQGYQGETIEAKMRRILTNKEPITDGAALIYTDRKDGVQPGFNIRTDRFEIAVDAMDKVHKSNAAKREGKYKIGEEAKENMEKEGEAQPIDNTKN